MSSHALSVKDQTDFGILYSYLVLQHTPKSKEMIITLITKLYAETAIKLVVYMYLLSCCIM